MKRGFYIMLEGGEGSGKDTHAKLLKQYFQKKKYKVILTKEPGGTIEAEQIRNILAKKGNNLSPLEELFLFEAARAANYRNVVIPNLKKGNIVIKTRGCPSSYTHQGYAGGINLNLIRSLNYKATFGLRPDLLLILDVPAKTGLKKELDAGRFAAKGLKYHEKVNQGYREIAKKNPHFCVLIPYEEGNIPKIQEKIRDHIREKLKI